jgi:hypothetical protein
VSIHTNCSCGCCSRNWHTLAYKAVAAVSPAHQIAAVVVAAQYCKYCKFCKHAHQRNLMSMRDYLRMFAIDGDVAIGS